MSRYIDADELKKSIPLYNGEFPIMMRAIRTAIDATPTADVVEVVRCKDCKWWTKQKDSIQGRCDMYGRYPAGYWYCANGERREG